MTVTTKNTKPGTGRRYGSKRKARLALIAAVKASQAAGMEWSRDRRRINEAKS